MNRRYFLTRGAAAAGLAVPGNVFRHPRFTGHADAPGSVAGTQPDVFAEAFREPSYVRTETSGEATSWSIGNGLLERTLQYSPAHGLFTETFRHKLSGTDFLIRSQPGIPPSAEFMLRADADSLLGAGNGPQTDFTLAGSRIQDVSPSGKLLEVRLKGRKRLLDISVLYAVYSGHLVVRKWMAITNREDHPIRLSHLAFESLNLQSAPSDEQTLRVYYGVQPREIFYTGRAEDTAIVQINSRTGEGLIVMNEAPGWMKRTEMNGWGKNIQVMCDTDLFPFERTLKPGATFTSARCGLAFFIEGRGMADPRWSIPTYTSQVLMKKGPGYQPLWFYNTWEPFFQNYDEQIVLESIPVASKMGLEVFTLDTGWGRSYADNEVDSQKFPHGFASIRAALENHGMRMGLWEPLAVVSSDSTVYREHPEWVIKDLDGNERTATFPGKSDRVMCLDSPYRDSAAKRIQALIREYNLAYAKIDLTTVFNAYGEAPGCYSKDHYHRNWAESLEGIYEGIQYVTDQIYQEHPDVLLDLTFELWGQKHVIDYGLLAAGDLDWMSNVDDATETSAGPRQARTLLYQRSLAIPVESMLIGNLRATTPSLEERFATAIGSAPLLLGDLRQLSPSQVQWYAEKIAWFKELRRRVPLNEGFFPLGDWLQPKCTTWDGFARLSRRGEGLMVIFKNESEVREASVRIPSYPDGRFNVRSVMTGDAIGSFSGEEFRKGVVVALPAEHAVQIVEIRKG
jgi:alpha-galactosidase